MKVSTSDWNSTAVDHSLALGGSSRALDRLRDLLVALVVLAGFLLALVIAGRSGLRLALALGLALGPVSYTHLTLPTIYSV